MKKIYGQAAKLSNSYKIKSLKFLCFLCIGYYFCLIYIKIQEKVLIGNIHAHRILTLNVITSEKNTLFLLQRKFTYKTVKANEVPATIK